MHRGWMDNDVFRGKFCRAGAWVWLIENACWKSRRFDIKGKTVTLERGQLVASLRYMAKAWGWSRDAVARYLTRLETETMIKTATATGETVITICNYNRYQDIDGEAATAIETEVATAPRQHRDSTATAPRQNKEGKEGKEEEPPLLIPPNGDAAKASEKYTPAFKNFWSSWIPHNTPKGHQGDAFVEWNRHIIKPGVDVDMVTTRAIAYCVECGRNDTNTQNIFRWIRKHRWEDERLPLAPARRVPTQGEIAG